MPDRRPEQAAGEGAAARSPFLADGLIGRETELARLRQLVLDARARVVTLTGPGGVGKTRLAWEFGRAAAAEFEGGVWFVQLVSVDRPRRVIASIARSLGLVDDETRLPDRLRERLREPSALLILDNFEHLLPAADAVAELAADCPQVSFVITSRQPLRLPNEQVMETTALPPTVASPGVAASPAVQLFLLRARQASSREIAPADYGAIAELCDRLDGLPLAIELAAQWMRSTTPVDLLPRFTRRLPRLRGGTPAGDPRHQTMRNAIAWSYELLEPAEQVLFRRLAIFTGGFTLRMAEQLARGRRAGAGYPNADGYSLPYPFIAKLGYDPTDAEHDAQDPSFALGLPALDLDALDGIRTLLDRSLIRRIDDGAGEARYDLLETIREFGLEQLAAAGEEAAVRHAHAAAMLAFTEATAEGMWHASERRWDRARADLEQPNIRQALDWLLAQGDPAAELAQRMVGNLWVYWQTRGLIAEGREWMERAAALRSSHAWTRASLLPALGFFCWIQGDDERATTILDEAVDVAAGAGMGSAEGSAHFFRALVAWRVGPAAVFEMIDHLERAETCFQAWSDVNGLGVCKLAFGVIARLSGSPDDAFNLFEEARALFVQDGYDWGQATAHYYAGEALRDLGRREEAIGRLREGLRRYWEQGDNWGAGGILSALACLAADDGDGERAARLFGGADALLARIGAFLPPTDLDAYRVAAAELRTRIGAHEYDAAHRAGQAAPPDELVAEALADAAPANGASPDVRLTRRQLLYVRELAAGFDLQTIARRQKRSPSSVYEIVQRICDRLDIGSWEEIAPAAVAAGLISAPPAKTRKSNPTE